jgi:hypothetical protein
LRKHHEYWLELGSECDDIVWRKKPSELVSRAIHVIDYKAYSSMMKEHALMKASLEFYAQSRNLTITIKDGHHDKHIVDNGRKAKQTLELLK